MFDDVVKVADQLDQRLQGLKKPLHVESKTMQIADLEAQAAEAGFWDDPGYAQEQMQLLNTLKDSITPWNLVRKKLEDVQTMIELVRSEADSENYEADVVADLKAIEKDIDHVEIETLLSGPHDAAPAILEVNAGAGGDEANDWAAMLLRMYLRWSDRHGFKAEIYDEVPGEVAGIKSTTVRIEGKNAYGLLQCERGVHRLVRLSPFNANNKRQTSFAGVDVTPEVAEIKGIEIPEKDLRTDYYRASGAGGQHVNKTSSAVRITHLPTNIVVSCQNERSQHQNREVAMNVLKAKLLARAQIENKASIDELRGERSGIEFGHQDRNYVFQPYTLVKDTRTTHETGDIVRVMDGEIDDFIDAYLRWQRTQKEEAAAENA